MRFFLQIFFPKNRFHEDYTKWELGKRRELVRERVKCLQDGGVAKAKQIKKTIEDIEEQ
jgi:hypothetical protein